MTDQYNGNERRAPQEQGWHLKKEVNLSIIISVVGIAIACVTAYTDLKKEIELIKADVVGLHQSDTSQQVALERAITVLQAHYTRMDSKLDRLIERTIK